MKIDKSEGVLRAEALAFETIIKAYEILLYVLAFIGPVLLLIKMGTSRPLLSLTLGVIGWHVAAALFAFLIVITKRLFIPDIVPGRYTSGDPQNSAWVYAACLHYILAESPFWRIIVGFSILRYLYFKGMGAKIDTSFFIVCGTQIPEPWALTVGHNTTIGLEAVISAHKVERGVLTYDPVWIGKNVTIGARSMILPGVRIDDGAVVSMNSVVWAGSNIPSGEVWSGNPAQKVEHKPRKLPD